MASSSTAAFPLGLFVGNPNGNDAAANMRFEADFNAFRTLMGTTPAFMNAFTDFSQDPSQWGANAGWTAWSWAQTGSHYVGPASGITPVIGVPLASNAAGWSNVDTFYRAIINGTYDAAYKSIVTAWAGQGYTTIQMRLAYEFDGNFMPWAPGNSSDAAANADFIAAWRHVADLVHQQGAASGIKVQTVWNPADINWSTTPPAQLYPGDSYVDILGVDAYSPSYPSDLTNWANGGASQAADQTVWASYAANRAHYWQFTDASQYAPTGNGSGWSMQEAIDFAVAHGKPLSLAETGAGNNGGTTGPADDPAFAQWLAGALKQAQARGVTIANVDIWATDQSDGSWGFLNGEKPLEAASWIKYFGIGATAAAPVVEASSLTTANVAAPVASTPPTAILAAPPAAVNPGTTIDQSHASPMAVAFISNAAPWLTATAANPIATQIGQHTYAVIGLTTDGNTGSALVTSTPISIADNQWGSAVTIVPSPPAPAVMATVPVAHSSLPADPLFDAAYYLAHNPDVAAAGVDPLQHYMTTGWKEGRDPSGYFDTAYYLAQNSDVKAAGVNPLTHFETNGWKEGRQPSLMFDDAKYLAANADVRAAAMDPLQHYMQFGRAEGRSAFLSGGSAAPDPLIDASFYDYQLGATLIPSGPAAAQQAAWSFHTSGWQQGFSPSAFFDTRYYLGHNPDVAEAHVDPLRHYETTGWKEGRDPSGVFSSSKYLAAYGDVKAAGMDPLLHYAVFGRSEGRTEFRPG